MGFEVIKKLRDEKGWTLRELSTRMDSYPQQISKFELGHSKLTIDWIKKFADVFEVDTSVIISGDISLKNKKEFDLPVKVVDRNFQFDGGMIPVLGIANGSSEALVLNFDEPIGEIARHPSQAGMKGAFAFEPRGESMSPRYEPGDKGFAIANQHPAREQDCLIELKNGEAYLKRYIKRTDKHLICRQFNPEKEWKRSLSEIKAVHAVVGRG